MKPGPPSYDKRAFTEINMVFITGTSGQSWHAFSEQLSACHPTRLSLVDATDWPFTQILQRSLNNHLIVFCESPASLIADVTLKKGEANTYETLNNWKKSAANFLALWRKNRERITVLNWEEYFDQPDAFRDWFASHFGFKAATNKATVSTTRAPLAARFIADAIVSLDREALQLRRELVAASQLITKKPAAPSSADPELALKDLVQSHHGLATQCSNLAKRNSSFVTALEGHQRQHALLSAQNHALAAERDSIAAELARNERRTTETYELLLQEIQAAHREAEAFFEQWKLAQSVYGLTELNTEHTLHTGASNGKTHSHVEFVVRGARVFDHFFRRLRFRLVCHHAKPGIAIFRNGLDTPPPLHHWHPCGQEEGIDYVLFVPSDAIGTSRLLSAPATDLALINGLADRVYSYLRVHGVSQNEIWMSVGLALIHQLNEIPDRVHYDSVATAAQLHGTPSLNDKRTFSFKLRNPLFRRSHAVSFDFSWRVDSDKSLIEIVSSEYNRQFLPTALHQLQAGPNRSIHLSLDKGQYQQQSVKLWKRLSAIERSFLLLLVKALPDFVFHLCEQHPDQKPNKERLTNQARKLYRRLRNLDRRLKLRNAIAKAIRR